MLQYVALFIVILAVMAAMNGFLFLMLRGLSRQLKEQVNSCFLRQLDEPQGDGRCVGSGA